MDEWVNVNIKEFSDKYMVNRNGEIYSIKSKRIIKPFHNTKGYLQIDLNNNGVSKTVSVHRIVALTFIENPLNLPQINHKNEIRDDNKVENLEWCDNKYNCNYGNHGKNISNALKGKPGHKIDFETKVKIRNTIKEYNSKLSQEERKQKYGYKASDELRKHFSEIRKGKPMSDKNRQGILETYALKRMLKMIMENKIELLYTKDNEIEYNNWNFITPHNTIDINGFAFKKKEV